MRTILVLCLSAGLLADDKKKEKIDGKKLVGRWEQGLGNIDKKSVRWTLEFGKDGKVTESISLGDAEEKEVMPYKVDGNVLTMTEEVGGKDMERRLRAERKTECVAFCLPFSPHPSPLIPFYFATSHTSVA